MSVETIELPEPEISELFEISDEELTALALAADPDERLAPDAVAIDLQPPIFAGALPAWYMPPVMARAAIGWRKPVVLSIILALVLIDALGLCITYGQLVVA